MEATEKPANKPAENASAAPKTTAAEEIEAQHNDELKREEPKNEPESLKGVRGKSRAAYTGSAGKRRIKIHKTKIPIPRYVFMQETKARLPLPHLLPCVKLCLLFFLKTKLLNLAEKGLLLDFSNVIRDDGGGVEIPIYCIGKIMDMDDMYNNLNRYKSRAGYSARLVRKSRKWMVDDESVN